MVSREPPVDSGPIWRPSQSRIDNSQMMRFAATCRERWNLDIESSTELHRWSIRSPEHFWATLWEFAGVVGNPGEQVVESTDSLHATRYFPSGTIDVVATMLRGASDELAVVAHAEACDRQQYTRSELRAEVAAVAERLRAGGVGQGDVVAAWATNAPGVLVTMLATIAVGTTFTSSSVEFGSSAVMSRFGHVDPTVLFVTPEYRYASKHYRLDDRLSEVVEGLPSLQLVIVDGDVPHEAARWGVPTETFTEIASRSAELETTAVPFNAPGWILYSSGTTGPPKCIVHRTGGVLLKHLSEQLLHCDMRRGDCVFYFTTPGWMMWNWLTSALATGASLVLYDGSPMSPNPDVLIRIAERERVTYFGTSPAYLESLRTSAIEHTALADLSPLRTIGVTGAPLAPRTANFAATWNPDIHVLSKSGGTDLCGGLVTGDPTSPVWPGEIQMPAFGVDVAIVDDLGVDVGVGETGELVSRSAFPSMPLGFLGDDDGSRLRATYYDRFPGCWHQSDFASRTVHGGYVIHGRSDTTLNANGVRIGTAEIYAELVHVDGIAAAAAVAQEWESGTRILLAVKLDDDRVLDDDLRNQITTGLRTRCSPRHVPASIVSVPDLPMTTNGKISEVAVTDVVNHRPVRGMDALANPDSIDVLREVFRERPPGKI